MSGLGDPLNFVTAEEYFSQINTVQRPESITSVIKENPDPISVATHGHQVTVKFDDQTLCIVQFIRPTLWRIRYDPAFTSKDQYRDENSRTLIRDFTSQLIQELDDFKHTTWTTTLTEDANPDSPGNARWVFKSEVTSEGTPGSEYQKGGGIKLYLYKKPFRIEAVRTLTSFIAPGTARSDKVVWETSEKPFRFKMDPIHSSLKDVVLDVVKPKDARYIGWGEQGGTGFMKNDTYMNYFNMDNMMYKQVYKNGPLDGREPLYHSDPYWLEVHSKWEHSNVTATFVDNYSQIAIDLGKSDPGSLKIGTRFNGIDVYLISVDDVPGIVKLHTSIIGRSSLAPRYVLGNHQACFGYKNKKALFEVANGYRNAKIPFDGLHIDVDLQNGFRTFTVDENQFPQPKEMFQDLAKMGVKCATNITPVISLNPLTQGTYRALKEGLDGNHFLKDDRYKTDLSDDKSLVRYVYYDNGKKEILANDHAKRPPFPTAHAAYDDYNFTANYDSGENYHGGVFYGGKNGTAGYYPNLYSQTVRKWWGGLYKELFDMGLEFVWQDMTTPALHQAYGDMKGLPSRLLVPADPTSKAGAVANRTKRLAIEVWALYSYNLHKATSHGLEALESRKGKRNFILGRGSFAGMYRYAGLWSGDNASTWEFWRITIPQVLSMGLNGVCISGSDTGGFEPNGKDRYCDPELLIRWYAGSFLLPWLRNHYNASLDEQGAEKKYFQEPWQYPVHFEKKRHELQNQGFLYYGVQYISKYFLDLRYTLLQLLYDAMFENQITGLPIARSMLLTDTQDTSFFNESQGFLDHQYVVGRDLLIAPIVYQGQEARDVYLPVDYFWYPSNLRTWGDKRVPAVDNRVPLAASVEGGSVINYSAQIPKYRDDEAQSKANDSYAHVTPMYIREGAIIPQIAHHDRIELPRSTGEDHITPIRFNIYPFRQRKNSTYTTYIDDGVSLDSAPSDTARAYHQSGGSPPPPGMPKPVYDKYRAVTITHEEAVKGTRTITITRLKKTNGKDDYDPKTKLGKSYHIILWYDSDSFAANYTVAIKKDQGGASPLPFSRLEALRAVEVEVPEILGDTESIIIKFVPT